jgi:hypothetical protein
MKIKIENQEKAKRPGHADTTKKSEWRTDAAPATWPPAQPSMPRQHRLSQAASSAIPATSAPAQPGRHVAASSAIHVSARRAPGAPLSLSLCHFVQ